MVSTRAEPEAGHAAGYRDMSQESNTQSSPGVRESHNDAHATAELSQTPPPQTVDHSQNKTVVGTSSASVSEPGHAALPQIPPADGLENSADIWADSVNSDLRRYNPPAQPFSAQVTGRTDSSSLNDQTLSEVPTSGIQLQSNNPFLKAKLSRDQDLNAASNAVEKPFDNQNASIHPQRSHNDNQICDNMGNLTLDSPACNTTAGVHASQAVPAEDRVRATHAVTSPTEPADLIDLDSHNRPEPEKHSVMHTPGESSDEKADRGKGVATQPNAHLEPVATNPTGLSLVPNIVEPAPSPKPASPAPSSQHSSHKSEIYDIRVVNWTDGTTELRQSPILVQNENGPCPLLALVNGLVLRSQINAQTPLIRALHSRERISLGLLIQALFDELISSPDGNNELPDIEALSVFLTMLHTGMNVNPRLTPILHPPTPGTFLKTRDIELYSTFNLPLVHGWTAAPSSPTHEAMLRVAEYHDDIQLLHFKREDLESRAINTGSLAPDEQQLFEDIDTIQRFVTVDHPTQLSPFGLQHLERSIPAGSICVLFRNDHFATLFKHPHSNQLFTLVTDAGYASHAEIVWESLVDVNGTNSELYSGDFRPVGHSSSSPSQPPPRAEEPSSRENTSTTEQTDADYAFALSLQYEDEQNRRNEQGPPQPPRRSQNNLRVSSETTSPLGRSQHQIRNTRSASFSRPNSALPSTLTPLPRTPTTHRPPPSRTQGFPPMVPPAPNQNNPVNDPNAPPPTYEQAAQEPAYIPPPNGPLHPQQQQHQPYHGPVGPNSQYNRMSGYGPGPHMSGRRRQYPASLSTSSLPHRDDYYRERDRNKDCIVM
ncbi:hypothetical protein H109_03268 [Trichophyton interdigitale MR816]|uniref:MINDY deubiquitinase domain-containing protein n=1 Tax=Trichophyton interdigitale (strain MR816) TaxID=1215338 RepID=A0A059JAH3_TRIIM|nr:hypothetical protein H101_02159 [Trichophyton interdigitale H6]KDB24886.1 hypothetical protein H109_03268 [Trichophyton interdigitale MR816]